ncbi:Gfo/Idh/MocA family oxidoreductase [Aliarcobacter skirrowii]|uniref:Gfo/Idh/MocA family protein n=1 Tax=Aliarcobacter skirrowii TaxID=28200 RepID=UPI0029BCCAD1|nr:Gfo/Idh/MocA family oxidoreductase [Aliarcobacter skirrowii]MDX4058013.1 Gfo/Idh/MocA family oxidoreductase [Aliarcobacter skirrowii]
MNNKIWLIGAGGMAQDYIKLLQGLEKNFVVIGRGKDTAKKCEETTGCKVQIGGLEEYLLKKPEICSHAIIAVGVERLYETTKQLLEYGVQNILVEKPGALETWQFEELNALVKEKNANVIIAYNRRFYASVIKAQEIIKNDGGVTSFNFEFTEWAHKIEPLIKGEGVKEKWFLGNSTHVVDLAFYLGGKPKEICTFSSGSLSWHPSASNFSGAGISENDALFNYQANWESAGRWSVEILTKKNKLIFRPMEKLQIQKRGTITKEFVESIDYTLDEKYKPGLYIQTKKFLEIDFEDMCLFEEQFKMIELYNKFANY